MTTSVGLGAAAGFAALLAVNLQPATTRAQDWPAKPIRVIVGFGPGGGTDIVSRIIAEPLGEFLGQSVVIENKPGAGSTIAADMVAKSPPDGYTASMLSAGHTVSAVMFKTLPYDSVKDFAPVGLVATSGFVIVARKDFPAHDIKGLIAIAKAAPGRLNFASVGVGSTQHFAGELFRQMAGIDVAHIPYRGTPAVVTALRRQEVDYAIELVQAVIGQIQADEIKPLAVTSPQRWPTLPQVPTVQEQGIAGYDVTSWYGLVFPAGTPKAITDKMSDGMKQVLARENVQKQIANAGAVVHPLSPQEFGRHLESEIAKWREVATKAKIEQQ
jgi:tripartite-type tricarboxylate transporter receptor subunit TctC